MTDGEREELIEFLRGEFYEMGEPELADFADYTIESAKGRFRAEPRTRLLKMLDAFEVVIALEDEATFKWTVGQIAEATDGAVPSFRILATPDEGTADSEARTFELQNQSDARSDLRELIDKIRRDGLDYTSGFDK
ncbi:hypothetical protein ACQQ2Q_15375 [Agrobacterium sp. ES01]|uniref:hypothetical protein n=1 Tax=Agrobacterium sp. ES01 TaxID=3420714 RepID=UPI003D0D988F